MYKQNGENSVTRLADGAVIPFVDGNFDYEKYKQWVKDGGVPEFVEAEVLVPQSITKIQAMLQLKVLNLWDIFKLFLAENSDANDVWMLALSVERDNSFVPIMAQVVGWNKVQTDNFFIKAAKL